MMTKQVSVRPELPNYLTPEKLKFILYFPNYQRRLIVV